MAQKTDIWMPLYVADYLADTAHLTTEEHGAYLLVLMAYWRNGGPLPADDKRLLRIMRADACSNAQALLATVLEFFTVQDGRLHHSRVEAELQAADERKAKAASRGKAGAEARWKAQECLKHGASIAQALPKTMLVDGSSPSPTHSNTPIAPKGASRGGAISLNSWLEKVKADGQKAIPDDDPVFSYAEQAGLPHEFLRLAWLEFRARYSASDKRYRDWRAVFRRAVRSDWFTLWRATSEGYVLTTRGVQAERAHAERRAA